MNILYQKPSVPPMVLIFYSFSVLLIYAEYKSGKTIRKTGAIYKETVLSALNIDSALFTECAIMHGTIDLLLRNMITNKYPTAVA